MLLLVTFTTYMYLTSHLPLTSLLNVEYATARRRGGEAEEEESELKVEEEELEEKEEGRD